MLGFIAIQVLHEVFCVYCLAFIIDTFVEELLINFCKLEGVHSGLNMAEAIWETLKWYKIKDQIIAIMANNISNNNTIIDEIVMLALENERAIQFNAQWIHMCCMPHIVPLAALKVCLNIPLPASINFIFFSFWNGSVPFLLLKGGRQGLAVEIIRLL